jgi:6-phosphogluconolactonase
MKKPDVIVTETEVLGGVFAGRVAALARAAIATRGRAAIALTGGSVAAACYPELARAHVAWSRVALYWGDERAVPPDDPESNYRLAREHLIDRLPEPPGAIHRMEAERGDLDPAARAYDRDLTTSLGVPPRLDVVILGLGPDGHVCSLFPGGPGLRPDGRWAIAIEDAPKPPPRRLTLTLSTLTEAHHLVVVAFGEAKQEAMRQALSATSERPIALLARQAADLVFIVDRAAEP